MTKQKQISTEQRAVKSIARKKSYLSCIDRYPLYSILLVLKEYEDKELYEECIIIKDALKDYKEKYEEKFPEGLKFPMHVSIYETKSHQNMMEKLNIPLVEEKVAKEKATLIKLKLPV